MTYNLTSIGILVILIGFALVFIGAMTQSFSGKSDTKVAVGGFIGFIPFGFGNDKRMVWVLITLMAIALVFFFIMNFFLQTRIK
tara:strand:- start:9631 stop:9882 length:252 start_codon:yes stop_codon:yes gene_type:complete